MGVQEDDAILKAILSSLSVESREKLEGEPVSLGDLEAALNPAKELTIEEELRQPQAANETVLRYLKRMKMLVSRLGEDEIPSVDSFIDTFVKGLHPSLKETTRNVILEQVKRVSRKSLKQTMDEMEDMLKVIADSSRDNILKPRNTCYRCIQRTRDPFDLDTVENACDEFSE